jgi:1-acyl-sn-glycerol-3-phosphate acyltransferase
MILLRSAVFNAWFFGVTFVLGLGGVAVRWLAPRRALDYAKFWARVVLGGARVICGIRFVVTGRENLPAGPAVIVSQHQSAFDTLVWLRLVPNVSYVFKAELARIPLFGPMLLAAGQIPLDRGASVGTVRKLLKAVDRAKTEGRQIVIFPEGTRVPVGQDVKVRGGFAMIGTRSGLPIIPVATDSGRFWARRAFRKRPGCVHIHIGEAIPSDLPQEVLIRTVKQRWREASFADNPVDKSVD